MHKNDYTGNDLLTWRAQDGVVGFFAEPAPELPFDDVAAGSWYYDFAKGIMVGTGGGHFSPAVATTRGMVVTTLYSMENEPAVTGACPFADVASGSYCEDAITWAAANGIVSGYNAATFCPNDEITREQLATMLYEYARYKGYDVTKAADLSGFVDQGSVSDFAVGPMQWAVAQELIFGVGGNAIAPSWLQCCTVFAKCSPEPGTYICSRHGGASIRMRPRFYAARRKTYIFQANF